MATVKQEEVTIRVESGLLTGLRKIAEADGRELDAVAEDAFREYAKLNSRNGADDEVVAHFARHDTGNSVPRTQ